MTMALRAYIPATLERLAAVRETGVVPADWPRVVAEADDEESEYAALMSAADLSQAMLDGPGRRVVIVAGRSTDGVDVPLRDVDAIHVDTHDDADPDDDLAWYATQELVVILEQNR